MADRKIKVQAEEVHPLGTALSGIMINYENGTTVYEKGAPPCCSKHHLTTMGVDPGTLDGLLNKNQKTSAAKDHTPTN